MFASVLHQPPQPVHAEKSKMGPHYIAKLLDDYEE